MKNYLVTFIIKANRMETTHAVLVVAKNAVQAETDFRCWAEGNILRHPFRIKTTLDKGQSADYEIEAKIDATANPPVIKL